MASPSIPNAPTATTAVGSHRALIRIPATRISTNTRPKPSSIQRTSSRSTL
ncbi:Uncharacterised protein [Mycobacteroides abscessus subsp. abscessus]|nr:Uncharacterised protein [Mycobacteroides abscessus subsp. abscessus]